MFYIFHNVSVLVDIYDFIKCFSCNI